MALIRLILGAQNLIQVLGKPTPNRSDEFSEGFWTAFDPPIWPTPPALVSEN